MSYFPITEETYNDIKNAMINPDKESCSELIIALVEVEGLYKKLKGEKNG
tara:strand:+ start:1383 stop:1532 length:150 start_codon:yes stop_codon:yes gene_type:complete